MLIFRGNKLFSTSFNILNRSRYSSAHKLAESVESERQELFLDRENCILVDANDKNLGSASKRDCHKVEGDDVKLHRAFSVFLFNKSGDMLLQKRSSHKVSSCMLHDHSRDSVTYHIHHMLHALRHLTSISTPKYAHKLPSNYNRNHLIFFFFHLIRSHFRVATQTLAVHIRCMTLTTSATS